MRRIFLLFFTILPALLFPSLNTNWTYDEFTQLLDQLEDGSLILSSTEELEQIALFLADLATQGSLGEDRELNGDIIELVRAVHRDIKIFNALDCGRQAYRIIPLVNRDRPLELLRISWFSNGWKSVKNFFKKHKKAILIAGAALVVITIAVITGRAKAKKRAAGHRPPKDPDPEIVAEIQRRVDATTDDLPTEEKVRNHSSYLTHELVEQSPSCQTPVLPAPPPLLLEPISQSDYTNFHTVWALEEQIQGLKWQPPPAVEAHQYIDTAFNTDFTPIFVPTASATVPSPTFHQYTGERFMAYGQFAHATRAFEATLYDAPLHTETHLDMGLAYLGMGEIDRAAEHWETFKSDFLESRDLHRNDQEFTTGFVKGAAAGCYEAGKDLLVFGKDLALHPVQTASQAVEAISIVFKHMKDGEFRQLGEAITPELVELYDYWDEFTVEERGELMGKVIFKNTADLLLTEAAGKLVTKGASATKDMAKARALLKNTEKSMILETAAEVNKAGKLKSVLDHAKATRPNLTKGWKVGDPINNLTKRGQIPKWSAVRRRYWKNKANRHKMGQVTEKILYEPTPQNIKRMERGKPPLAMDYDLNQLVSVELHHCPPQCEGGLFDVIEVTPSMHAELDASRKLKK